MSFFDALGTGLGLEVAAGVGIVVVGCALRNQFRNLFSHVPELPRASQPEPREMNRVARLITDSKPSEWENARPGKTAKEEYDEIIKNHCMWITDHWHHKPTGLWLISTKSYAKALKEWRYVFTARVQEPSDQSYSKDVIYSELVCAQINSAWDALRLKMEEIAARKSRKKVDDLLDATLRDSD